jgi:hypothetical protein
LIRKGFDQTLSKPYDLDAAVAVIEQVTQLAG